MAKQGFSRVKGNLGEYKRVMNGGSVQRILASEASNAEGGANAFTNAHDHPGSHFATKQVQESSPEAMWSTRQHTRDMPMVTTSSPQSTQKAASDGRGIWLFR